MDTKTLFTSLTDLEGLETMLHTSESKPVVLFIHSASCPISAEAHYEVSNFLLNSSAPGFLVIVQLSEHISDYIAEMFSIRHESPQVMIIHHRLVVWHTSHYGITEQALHSQTLPLYEN